MDLKCQLVTRTSKQGKPYEVIVIQLTNSYEKLVFLDTAEKELIKFSNGSESTVKSPFDM